MMSKKSTGTAFMRLLYLIPLFGIALGAAAHTSTTYMNANENGGVCSEKDSTVIFLNGKKVTAKQLIAEDANTFGDVHVASLKDGDAAICIVSKASSSQEGMVKKPASENRYFINGHEVAEEEFRNHPDSRTVTMTSIYNKETGSKDRYLISTMVTGGDETEYLVNGRKVSSRKFGKLSASQVNAMSCSISSGRTVISVTAE